MLSVTGFKLCYSPTYSRPRPSFEFRFTTKMNEDNLAMDVDELRADDRLGSISSAGTSENIVPMERSLSDPVVVEAGVEVEVETERSQTEITVGSDTVTSNPSTQNDGPSVEDTSRLAAQNSGSIVLQESTHNLVQTAVNVVCVSGAVPNVTSSPEDFKGKEKMAVGKDSPPRDDESECCPICFEPWSNSGSHRLSSLNCGHLFGRSCIEKWLRGKTHDKCPQCNAPAKRKQIRNIYAKAIKAVDTYERDSALEQLEKEKQARKRAEEAEAKALLQYQLARAECDRMKAELERQQTLVLEQGELAKQSHGKDSSASGLLHGTGSQSIRDHKYLMQTSWQVTQTGARVMVYDTHTGTLAVSKPSPNQLFPGYGVMKVSSLDNKHSQYISIHDKPIRDAVFSSENDSLLLTASVDKTLKITSIQTNTTVLSYSTPAAVWSCAWNTCDTNYVYAGLQNGQCYVFDMRNTTSHLKSLKREDTGCCPLVSLAFVPRSAVSSFKLSGLLTCSLEGGCFWENTFETEYAPHPLNFPEGSCTCLRFEPTTRHCLVSQRPSRSCNRSRHAIIQLNGTGLGQCISRNQPHNQESHESINPLGSSVLCTSQVITHCYGGSCQKLLGHSTLFTSPDDDAKLLVCAGDESTNSAIVWDGSSGQQMQSLPNQGGTVIDVCAFETNNTNFLATLTDQKLSFYKWQ